jgi:hypothetical protein
MVPGAERLSGLLRELPAPTRRYSLDRFKDAHGPAARLDADEDLRTLERQWRDVFPRAAPMLTALSAKSSAWQDPSRWLDWLDHHAAAFDSFEVLDDLANAALSLPSLGEETETLLRRPLLERAERLLRLALSSALDTALPWACLENRPALRLVANLIASLEGGSDAERQRRFELLEWMVSHLNPNDNHGFRDQLVGEQLERGAADAALAVCARYPEDAGPFGFHHALALFLAGRREEADKVLARAREDSPKIFAALRRKRMRTPSLHPGMVTMGGDDEAWYYRQDFRGLWERTGGLAWLMSKR